MERSSFTIQRGLRNTRCHNETGEQALLIYSNTHTHTHTHTHTPGSPMVGKDTLCPILQALTHIYRDNDTYHSITRVDAFSPTLSAALQTWPAAH